MIFYYKQDTLISGNERKYLTFENYCFGLSFEPAWSSDDRFQEDDFFVVKTLCTFFIAFSDLFQEDDFFKTLCTFAF